MVISSLFVAGGSGALLKIVGFMNSANYRIFSSNLVVLCWKVLVHKHENVSRFSLLLFFYSVFTGLWFKERHT